MKPHRILLGVLLIFLCTIVCGAKGRHFVNNTGQSGQIPVDSTQKKTDSTSVLRDSIPISAANTATDSLIKRPDSAQVAKDSLLSSATDSSKKVTKKDTSLAAVAKMLIAKKMKRIDTAKMSPDSIALIKDSITRVVNDSLLTAKKNSGFHFKVAKDGIDDEVTYKAKDSIIYDIKHRIVYLYTEGKMHYKDIDVTADNINMDWNTTTLTSETKKDTAGEPVGDVVFKQGQETFYAKKMAFNFKSKKGKVFTARSKQDEGYIHLEQGKRDEHEDWYARHGRFTTCDLENPHFYIQSSKMKVVPQKLIVTGPAHLVVHEIPIPFYLPFGLFPTKKGRRSGIILPQYGEEAVRGFYFRGMGYYFGINDYFDLTLTGDIYTKGSWGLRAAARYVKKYAYNGNFSFQYGRNLIGEPEAPSFNVLNDFKLNWVHNQDPKAHPDTRFTADVNAGTSTYDKNFSYNQAAVTNSALASKISFSRTWGAKPYSLGINFAHDQNLNTHQINLTLPQLTFGIAQIQPFKRKITTSQPKWYEKLSLSYTLEAQNIIHGVDSTFFKSNTLKKSQYGIRHTLPISTSFKLFKYFILTPSINYTERWYFQTAREHFAPDSAGGSVLTDTIFGFKTERDFNAALSLTTTVYGMYQFKNSKIKAIRHVMTPSISFNYHPDYGTPFWGYYKTVQTDALGNTAKYSIFQPGAGVYGDAPPPGLQAGLNFAISNTLEMKVFSKKDSLKHEKKIKLLENFTVSASYNFAADSLKLSPISISGYTTLFDKFRVNFATSLDPYAYDSLNQRVNRFVWQDRRLFAEMRSASFSVSTSLQSKKGGALNNINSSNATEEEKQMVMKAPSLYYDFTIPWSINFAYNLNVNRGVVGKPDSLIITANSIRIGVDISITEKWKVAVESGYDFILNDLVYTRVTVIRNLHCWELSFHWVPYPLNRQSYDMQLNVKSAILQDLKISKKKDYFDSAF